MSLASCAVESSVGESLAALPRRGWQPLRAPKATADRSTHWEPSAGIPAMMRTLSPSSSVPGEGIGGCQKTAYCPMAGMRLKHCASSLPTSCSYTRTSTECDLTGPATEFSITSGALRMPFHCLCSLGGISKYGSPVNVFGTRGVGGIKSTLTHNGHASVHRPPPCRRARNPETRTAPATKHRLRSAVQTSCGKIVRPPCSNFSRFSAIFSKHSTHMHAPQCSQIVYRPPSTTSP